MMFIAGTGEALGIAGLATVSPLDLARTKLPEMLLVRADELIE
jgi:hypothetical protein